MTRICLGPNCLTWSIDVPENCQPKVITRIIKRFYILITLVELLHQMTFSHHTMLSSPRQKFHTLFAIEKQKPYLPWFLFLCACNSLRETCELMAEILCTLHRCTCTPESFRKLYTSFFNA